MIYNTSKPCFVCANFKPIITVFDVTIVFVSISSLSLDPAFKSSPTRGVTKGNFTTILCKSPAVYTFMAYIIAIPCGRFDRRLTDRALGCVVGVVGVAGVTHLEYCYRMKLNFIKFFNIYHHQFTIGRKTEELFLLFFQLYFEAESNSLSFALTLLIDCPILSSLFF